MTAISASLVRRSLAVHTDPFTNYVPSSADWGQPSARSVLHGYRNVGTATVVVLASCAWIGDRGRSVVPGMALVAAGGFR